MVTPPGNKGVVAWRRECKEQCQVNAGDEDHARSGWTASRRGQDSPWKSQSEWQRTEINGESTSMVWPTLWSRTAKEQNYYYYCTRLTASFPGQPGKPVPERQNQYGLKWSKRRWCLGWQWHQLNNMQTTCTSLEADNHTNTSSLNFYRPDALPKAQPIVSKQWRHRLKNRPEQFMGTFSLT